MGSSPRNSADEPGPPPDPEPPESGSPEPLDESVTQVFSADAAWEQSGERAPLESAPHSPPPEYVMPERTDTGRPAPSSGVELERPRTIEAAQPAGVAGVREPDDCGRRPRSPQDRAARREQRRRQLRRRRLVALAILIAIVVLIVFLIVRGCGGSDAGAATALGLVVGGRFLVAPGRQ